VLWKEVGGGGYKWRKDGRVKSEIYGRPGSSGAGRRNIVRLAEGIGVNRAGSKPVLKNHRP